MDQRRANREAKRAALAMLPDLAPLPPNLSGESAERWRLAWQRMRSQLEREAGGVVEAEHPRDPGQLAAWSPAELLGPACEEHDGHVVRIEWGPLVDGLPDRWVALHYACGCVRRPAQDDAEWAPVLAGSRLDR